MGSAVDTNNLTRELERYAKAGWGGVHIIPIYGAKGWEDKYIPYLSPQWMAMLRYTVAEAQRLGMAVDMTLGTGWCFGGPTVTDEDANARVVVKTFDVPVGTRLKEKFDPRTTQALMAFAPDGHSVELTGDIAADGTVDWTAEGEGWRVYAVSQKPSGRKVKRAAPGGEGPMLNLIYPQAMRHYLEWFTQAFAHYDGPKPRAVYHDSYEYLSDWAPDFFAQFKQRRGYRLQAELPALFSQEANEHVARVKCDYRETVSDVMAEATLPLWVNWAHARGMLTRNEAHGSPGNLLDLYALADIPETEMFHLDRSVLVSKFASSAAHTVGRQLVAAETGTWLQEHFTETLADVKYLLDDLFLSGVNHVAFHGTCYSPDEAAWPGWLFYASTEMNPRNSIWHDVPALAAYIARCQSVLQAGQPDDDVLLYWPIYDFWQQPKGLVQPLTVHARDWLEGQPIGRAAKRLWDEGYAFDYVSDRQLALGRAGEGGIEMPGGHYRVIAVPECRLIPLKTMQRLLDLAEDGATVILEKQLPADVPGLGNLETRREKFQQTLATLQFAVADGSALKIAKVGVGRVIVGDLAAALAFARVPRETLVDHPGLRVIRRRAADGRWYFVANRGEATINGWIPLTAQAGSIVVMDPASGRAGLGALRPSLAGGSQVYLQLAPGESIILHALEQTTVAGDSWPYYQTAGEPVEVPGEWKIRFVQGGPVMPLELRTPRLASWTELGGDEAQRFAGTARYTITFDRPPSTDSGWWLDLGLVCQSARVRLNGRDLGTLFVRPFRVPVAALKAKDNVLEVDVTNVSANRIRDLDRRKVPWQNFHDINFVNIDYKKFNAAKWPLTDSGLLGPVRLVPVRTMEP